MDVKVTFRCYEKVASNIASSGPFAIAIASAVFKWCVFHLPGVPEGTRRRIWRYLQPTTKGVAPRKTGVKKKEVPENSTPNFSIRNYV